VPTFRFWEEREKEKTAEIKPPLSMNHISGHIHGTRFYSPSAPEFQMLDVPRARSIFIEVYNSDVYIRKVFVDDHGSNEIIDTGNTCSRFRTIFIVFVSYDKEPHLRDGLMTVFFAYMREIENARLRAFTCLIKYLRDFYISPIKKLCLSSPLSFLFFSLPSSTSAKRTRRNSPYVWLLL